MITLSFIPQRTNKPNIRANHVYGYAYARYQRAAMINNIPAKILYIAGLRYIRITLIQESHAFTLNAANGQLATTPIRCTSEIMEIHDLFGAYGVYTPTPYDPACDAHIQAAFAHPTGHPDGVALWGPLSTVISSLPLPLIHIRNLSPAEKIHYLNECLALHAPDGSAICIADLARKIPPPLSVQTTERDRSKRLNINPYIFKPHPCIHKAFLFFMGWRDRNPRNDYDTNNAKDVTAVTRAREALANMGIHVTPDHQP